MATRVTPEKLASSGTEDGEQTALFCYAAEAARTDARWLLLYAVPNGGARNPATAARMAATGAKAGFPDVGLPYVIREGGKIVCPGLFIEMKRMKQAATELKPAKSVGRIADAQTNWHNRLLAQGYRVNVCYGYEEAITVIRNYFNEG